MKKHIVEVRELVSFIAMSCLVVFATLPFFYYVSEGLIPEVWLKEDGVYESLAAITCIVTAVALACFGIMKNFSNKLVLFWLISFSFSLFLLGGEEISWGQRIIGFETPENIAKTNYQKEFNLHNSTLIQSHNNKLSVYLTKILVVYIVIFPIFLNAFPSALKFSRKIRFPTPPLSIALTALIAQLISTQTFRLIYGSTEVVDSLSLGETLESILELCLCWVALSYIYLISKDK